MPVDFGVRHLQFISELRNRQIAGLVARSGFVRIAQEAVSEADFSHGVDSDLSSQGSAMAVGRQHGGDLFVRLSCAHKVGNRVLDLLPVGKASGPPPAPIGVDGPGQQCAKKQTL